MVRWVKLLKEEKILIELKNVTKKYGDFVAVDGISFKIEDGEIIGLLGPNGAGKSTTMNMITGFIEPTEGQIIVDGFDILKKPRKAKKQIGYMPENVPLYMELTVKEFVKYMAELKYVDKKQLKEEVERVIKQTGLEDVQNKLIRNLSRGYKQRVSLAGSLVGHPKILILDEPTVGLDPKQITEIRSLIANLSKEHTIILSSHILSEVSQICKKVIIINKGKIVAIDTPENLESKVNDEKSLIVTVEDTDNKIEEVIKNLENIKEIKLVKDFEDGTKQYIIIWNGEEDLRKKIFEYLAKENITIFEMKKPEATLEDAFMNVISKDNVISEEKSDDEPIEKEEQKKTKEEKKEEKKRLKEEKKKQKEEKKRKKEVK